jgi:hypothetical protein
LRRAFIKKGQPLARSQLGPGPSTLTTPFIKPQSFEKIGRHGRQKALWAGNKIRPADRRLRQLGKCSLPGLHAESV